MPERLTCAVALHRSAADLIAADVASASLDELGDVLRTTRRLINEMELTFARAAARYAAVHNADEANVGNGEDAIQWLREECRMTSHAARVAIHVGEHEPELRQSIEAVEEGTIGMAHLGWMADTAERLEHSGSRPRGKFDENALLKQAKRLNVQGFRRQCDAFIHRADHEAFVRDEIEGAEGRRLRLVTHDDGVVHLDAWLDREGGELVRAAIDPFARKDGADDHRELAQRRADALIEVCNHVLDTGQVPRHGGQRPHVYVTATLDTLRDVAGAPPASLESGALISGTAVERLACDSTIVRVLLDSASIPIDVGRAARVVPASTRRALNVRDNGCVWPGCDRTASWTQAHHLVHWTASGPTNMSNLCLLCWRHHARVHEGGWVIARTNDGEILTFAPDPWDMPRGREPTTMIA